MLQIETGDRAGLADTLEALANLAVVSRRVSQSPHLFGVAQSLRDATGHARTPSHQPAYEADLELARRRIGHGPLDAGWQIGMESQAEAAANYVASTSTGQALEPWERLTVAERKVEGLVAEGLTNAEVAQRLFVPVRTGDSHLRKVFIKLSVSSLRELVARPARERRKSAPVEGRDR